MTTSTNTPSSTDQKSESPKRKFTLDQIRAAHSKVKSGADFPRYVQDIRLLGVTSYETFVMDCQTRYFGKEGYEVLSDGKYATLSINDKSQAEQFQTALKDHQNGKTDFITFCQQCAQLGVEKWTVSMGEMTCTYFGKDGSRMLVETIPHG